MSKESILEKIDEIKGHTRHSYDVLEAKGATLPDNLNTENLAATIDQMSSEGVAQNKYGTTLDELLTAEQVGDTIKVKDSNAVKPDINLVFDGIKSIDSCYVEQSTGEIGIFGKIFYGRDDIKSVNFPDLEQTDQMSLHDAFGGCRNITTVKMPKLKLIAGGYSMQSAFSGCTGLLNVDLSGLETIAHESAVGTTYISASPAGYMFNRCSSLTAISFDSLTTIEGEIDNMFSNCTSLTAASFPSLKTLGASCSYLFYKCTSLTHVDFSALEEITDELAGYSMFSGCTALTTISFPSLVRIVTGDIYVKYMFSGCPNLTEIHFREDAQSAIEATEAYQSMFGATNATIYFDL